MDSIKDIFKRYFTKELENDSNKTVFELFKWKKVNVLMKDFKTGKVLCDMKDLEFPERYSQNACDIIASKYFIKAGIPNIDHETSMRQVAHRLALFYKESLEDEGLIKTTEEGNIFYDEIVYCLLSQKFAPNSPAWFNVGLNLAYGIKGEPNDQYYYDEKKKRVIKSKDAYTRAQVSACFILSIKDALIGKHSITENLTSQTKLFKFGSGVGSNYSIIRAKGEKLSGGGKSSGLMSFLKVFDRNAGAIKSGGKNRRSAAMICIDIDHPEIEDFIKWKSREEDKVRALGKMGYDADINGEAYETVSGQNGNNSVRLTDEFMKKVANLDKEPNATITLKGRVDQSINREIKVKDLWEEFNKAIWECADPAPQFDDTFNEWHTCPAGEDGKVGAKYNKISSSNPCVTSECRLLTTSGYIPIGKLENQTVNIVNAMGDISQSQVWCSGEKEIYKFRLATGKIIRGTGNHIFRTNNGYQSELKDLKGKRLMPYLNCNYRRSKGCELWGFAQGDGNLTGLTKNGRLSLNIGYKDGDIANYFNLKVHNGIAYVNDPDIKYDMLRVGFSDKSLPERELPATFDTCWGYVEVTSFLRGLYSANGSVLSNGRITFKSTCYSLVYDLRCMLWQLDISSYITTNRAHMVTFRNGDYMCKESYDLNILKYDDRVKFYNMIGFIQGYKMERLRNLLIEQSPKIMSVVNTHKKEKVYDFTEPLTHWGVVEGYVAHNCGEYAFLDDTSCNLASINVYNFYDPEKQKFDVIGYEHLIHLTQLVLEASINWGQFPTPDIARKTYNFRATGLGISNLASLLMVQGYPYDSEEARMFAMGLIGILTGESYYTSALMAKEIGAFRKYDINKKYMLNVIKHHIDYIENKLLPENCISLDTYDLLIREANHSFVDAYKAGQKFGYRNAQVSVMAPTGTISFAMDCGSTSIEPYFSHVAYKKLAGGGGMLITNPIIEQTLKNLNYYSDNEIKEISDYIIKNHKIEGAPHLDPVFLRIFDTANKCGDGERYIQPMGHVKMVAAITPLISGAVSKTVNLPREATIDDFKEVILESWRMGVKGITLYRDGSKAAQPLNSTNDESIKKNEELTYKELLDKVNQYEGKSNKNSKSSNPVNRFAISAPKNHLMNKCPEQINSNKPIRKKMDGIRTGTTHPAIIDGVKIYTTVNRKPTGEIGEIYVTTDREGSIITGLLNSISKTISVMLQYGIDPKDISKMFRGQKYEPYGFVQNHPYIKSVDSISDLISKVIDIELGDFSRCQVKPSKAIQAKYLSQNGMNFEEIAKKLDLETSNIDKTKKMKDFFNENSSEDITNHIKETKHIEDSKSNAFQKEEKVYGKTCPNCGSTRMLRNGTCYVCRDCGSTTGCS